MSKVELKACPYCKGKAVVRPFIFQIAELPEPIKLFGRWSLIKMRYREIPCKFEVECDDLCDGFLECEFFAVGDTKEEAIKQWNMVVGDGK